MLRRGKAQNSAGASKSSKRRRLDEQQSNGGALEKAVFGGDGVSGGSVLGEGDQAAVKSAKESKAAKKKAAWVDDDDQNFSVDVAAVARSRKLRETETETELRGDVYASRLRKQFEKIHGQPAWASANEFVDGEKGPDLLARSSKLLTSGSKKLPQGRLEVIRLHDANAAATSKANVQVTQFHPTAPALMTAGFDKTIRIFQIDGKENPLLQTVFIPDLPISSAHFANHGNEIICSGRRKFFYSYDIEAGKMRKINEIQGRREKSLEKCFVTPDSQYIVFTGQNGNLIVVSNKTKQWVANLKMNGTARAVSFVPDDPHRLLSSGGDGQVYVWDLRMNRCQHIFTDDGGVETTALAVSQNGEHVACGSDSGVVNLYDSSCFAKPNPKPVKALMNLVTPIDKVQFHPHSQLLCMTSRHKKEALRMVHVQSRSVFANWPTAGTPLQYINSFDFSPGGGYAAMGNDKGKVLLYRLSHYSKI